MIDRNIVGIGKGIPRLDAELQLTGKCRYGADIAMPGMLHCKILRPPMASAKILNIDYSEALKLPGVAAVVTAKDIPGYNRYGMTLQDQPYIADDTVYQCSDTVAAVAAETEDIAENALKFIKVDYEPLPIVTDPREAMKEDSYKVHGGTSNIAYQRPIIRGDVEKGFAESAYILEQNLSTPGIEHCSIETHAGISYIDQDSGDLCVRSSVQKPFELAVDISKELNMPLSHIRVYSSCIGGGFGGKNETTFEPAIVLLTVKTGRPVRCDYTREEEFSATTVRHAYYIHYKTGISKKGKILARAVNIISDCGAYVSWGASTLTKAAVHALGPYVIPNSRVDGYLVYTNNPVGGAMRGFGVTQLGFAYEAHTEYCAEKIGMDSLEFRRLNLIHDRDTLPTEMIMEIVSVEDCLNRAIELAKEGGDWE
jgi:CO/xanthine dehydrogenase Mo-binding subunit